MLGDRKCYALRTFIDRNVFNISDFESSIFKISLSNPFFFCIRNVGSISRFSSSNSQVTAVCGSNYIGKFVHLHPPDNGRPRRAMGLALFINLFIFVFVNVSS